MSVLSGQKVLMIIASQSFRDEEYSFPRQVLEEKGATIFVASSKLDVAHGMRGATVKPDLLVRDVKGPDYDGIILVGGSGASEYWDDPVVHKMLINASRKKQIIGAICIAPVTLAKAGLLRNKKAAVFHSQIKTLQDLGTECTGKAVERTDNLITADGPGSALEFGEAFAGALASRKEQNLDQT